MVYWMESGKREGALRMIAVPETVLGTLAEAFGLDAGALSVLGGGRVDSDGTVYRAGGGRLLKVVHKRAPAEQTDLVVAVLAARAAFFAYLGAHGVDVVAPAPAPDGRLVADARDGEDLFLAYSYPYLAGAHPDPKTWDGALVSLWGETIGRAHRIAQGYALWDGVPLPGGHVALTWQAEIGGMEALCPDEAVKAVWRGLRARLDALGYDRASGGFIHNDPHMQNILYDGKAVKLLDFDVSCCHFFACDLAIAIQSVLFATAGGMERPLADAGALRSFTDALLSGYGRVMPVPADIGARLSLFVDYRRALLFTVMQDWLVTQPAALAAWRGRVLEAEPLFGWLS